MSKFNLSDAAKAILTEASKETFDANIAAKQGQRGQGGVKPEVGESKLSTDVAYGMKDAGKVGDAPEDMDDENPDYTKGSPTATPPGATPPVGSEPMKKLSPQPQETQGRGDLRDVKQSDATDFASIRDRIAGKLAPQTMEKNPGATFQSYAEDMEAMFSGENLSEEFKQKASTIFEAAVIARAETIVKEMETEMMEQFEEAVETIKEDLAGKIDDYLNYMVEEWVKENEIAITQGLRAEIVEDFIDGLRNLFVEHYIDIPEEKVDVVEELTNKVDELETELNSQIAEAVEMKKQINDFIKQEAIHAVCEGLTQTQVEKMKSLAEGVEFTTDEEFVKKLVTIKESYFKETVKPADESALNEGVEIEEEKKETISSDPLIAQYAKTISQTLVK